MAEKIYKVSNAGTQEADGKFVSRPDPKDVVKTGGDLRCGKGK